MSKSIEAILTSVSPEIARRVEEHKARELAAKKQRAMDFQAAERGTTATRKAQRQFTVRAQTWLTEKFAELRALAARDRPRAT